MPSSRFAHRRGATTLTLAAALSSLVSVSAIARTPSDPPTTPPVKAPVAPPVAPAPDAAVNMVGKSAPDFTLPDQNDKPHTLKDSHGKWVVLAFYPKDMTTGCTFQNISYTRTSAKFAPLNAVVYTISTQDTASKKEFCAKDSLTHTLLADVGGKTAVVYGVLHGAMARRVTFYVAPDGAIIDVDTKINTRQAGEDSLARLAKLEEQPRIPGATKNVPGAVTAPQ